MTTENLDFSADVSRLLDIVANALYSNRDVFLRELISNAADACDRLRYDALSNEKLIKGDSDLRIEIRKDATSRKIYICDNGVGMNRDDLVDNLGTIARSGTSKIMDAIKSQQESGTKGDLNLIGQFGVGFYASFTVSDHVEVISRKAGDKETWLWTSDGKTGYSIESANKEQEKLLIGPRGTTIILTVKDDGSDYLIDERLKHIILTYSDHIDIPIYVGYKDELEEGQKWEAVNTASALWLRPKSEITTEQYNAFFGHLSGGYGVDEPLSTLHWKAEGTLEFTSLLFVPSLRPWDLYDPSRKAGLQLYVKRVFITDKCEELLHPWLRFVQGIVDCQDLPLNISREMLQHNMVLQKIRTAITRRVLKDLNKLSENDPVAFEAFWLQFGPVIKEGLYDAVQHRDEIFKICRFYSTHEDGKMTTLEDYVSRMGDGQKSIFYISGAKAQALKNSPQIEGFKARGIEVLLLEDTIDDFWIQSAMGFKDHPLVSVTKGDIDLDNIAQSSDEKAKDKTDDDKKEDKKDDATLVTLIDRMKIILGDEIGDVRTSTRLTSSPVCLVAGDKEADLNLEKMLRLQQQYQSESKRILEINATHPLIMRMAEIAANDTSEKLEKATHLLLDQARIIQGESVSDPTSFAQNMSDFIQSGI
jgi:molecular chaperone HtpG|tara:strand:- start:407961 stop:409901 length:1941 start_codon:yes stop_codon:yes gene_type:complete